MELQIQTFDNSIFKINCSPDISVLQLKKEIEKTNEKFACDKQVLVFIGSILHNETILKDNDIKNGSTIILMIKKQKINKPKDLKKKEKIESQNELTDTKEQRGKTETTKLVSLKEEEEKLCNMGYNLDKVKEALTVSDNNILLAIEYLSNENTENNTENININELLQNPYYLQGILKKICNDNPALLDQIEQNPRLIDELLKSPQVLNKLEKYITDLQNENITENESNIQVENPLYSSNIINTLELSEEDYRTIETLTSFGFPEDQVIEAYIVCDKDKEKTANLLFSN